MFDNVLSVSACKLGQTVENECNSCVCSDSHVYECTPKSSNLCKGDTQNSSPSTCHPNIIYVLNDTICICDRTGHWPHQQCNEIFKSLGSIGTQTKCNPGSYVADNCNVCKCGPDGKIDKNHCTKNNCETTESINNISKSRRQNNVYGNCEAKNWYSLAPCQFCFCINENKLVCNTGNVYSHKMELVAYNLSICGKELIREAIALIPDDQKTLRYGVVNSNEIESETTPMAIKPNKVKLQQSHTTINSDREGNDLRVGTNSKQSEEYYTESEEEKPSIKVIAREGASTLLPYDDESPTDLDDESKDSEQLLETDNEVGVEIEAQTTYPINSVLGDIEFAVKSSVNYKQAPLEKKSGTKTNNLGEALKLNLPMVLDKVFQTALSKSLVSIDSDSECTPGTVTILKCN
ncbi:Pacifastin-related serine protease inhibitor, partial [Operophtera brumata]